MPVTLKIEEPEQAGFRDTDISEATGYAVHYFDNLGPNEDRKDQIKKRARPTKDSAR